PPQFRVEWTGYVVVSRTDTYTFATTSDDGSTLVIDGERVVDNSGDHGPQTRAGRITLSRGSHLVLLTYAQAGGDYMMQWLWARGGASLAPVPTWVVWTRHTSYARAFTARILDVLFVVALIATAVSAAGSGWQSFGRDAVGATRRWWLDGVAARRARLRRWGA